MRMAKVSFDTIHSYSFHTTPPIVLNHMSVVHSAPLGEFLKAAGITPVTTNDITQSRTMLPGPETPRSRHQQDGQLNPVNFLDVAITPVLTNDIAWGQLQERSLWRLWRALLCEQQVSHTPSVDKSTNAWSFRDG